jgi:hypothetical protein
VVLSDLVLKAGPQGIEALSDLESSQLSSREFAKHTYMSSQYHASRFGYVHEPSINHMLIGAATYAQVWRQLGLAIKDPDFERGTRCTGKQS